MSRKLGFLALGFGMLVACSQASSNEESTASSSQKLDPSQMYAPIVASITIDPFWSGNTVELLAADAYYACSFVKARCAWSEK